MWCSLQEGYLFSDTIAHNIAISDENPILYEFAKLLNSPILLIISNPYH
ncbi:hypothetical protein HMPREF1554_01423 [Porphyromonas gingivalis F0569]|nr:hypothetical protein HMPREF1554_01423 [Porphyromonas gingivalis F0569]